MSFHVLIFMIQLCLLMPLFQNIFNIFLVSLLQNTKRTTVVSYFLLHSITKQGDKSLISLKLTIRILSCEALKLKVHIQSSEALKLKVCTQSSNALKSSKLSCSFICNYHEKCNKKSQFLFADYNLFIGCLITVLHLSGATFLNSFSSIELSSLSMCWRQSLSLFCLSG